MPSLAPLLPSLHGSSPSPRPMKLRYQSASFKNAKTDITGNAPGGEDRLGLGAERLPLLQSADLGNGNHPSPPRRLNDAREWSVVVQSGPVPSQLKIADHREQCAPNLHSYSHRSDSS